MLYPHAKTLLLKPVKKEVFLRVTRPDGLVITKSPDNIFNFGEETMIYTESRTVEIP